MKRTFIAFILSLLMVGVIHAEMRLWTSDMGSTVEAELIGYKDGYVTLNAKDGRTIELPLNRLSSKDQSYITVYRTKLALLNQPNSRLPSQTYSGLSSQSVTTDPAPEFEAAVAFLTHPLILALTFALFLISFISGCALIYQAFSISFLWGLAYLFIPFAALVFVIQYWHYTKKAFLWSFCSSSILIATYFYAMVIGVILYQQ